MDMKAPTNVVEIAKAIGSLATPIAVAMVAYMFQRRQKVAEATMSERIRRVGAISPPLNKVFSYRLRVGNFLDCTPEEILEAKRESDREFWTYEYLWSRKFKKSYHDFMNDSFSTFRGEGIKASVRAASKHYPKKSSVPGWTSFTEEEVNKSRCKAVYDALQSAIAGDVGFRR